MSQEESIISHGTKGESLEQIIEKTQRRIQERGDLSYVSVDKQLEILDELTKFPLGQFLLRNKGLDGYWTDYVVSYPQAAKITGKDSRGRCLTEFEKIILEELFRPTQERAIRFKELAQSHVKDGAVMASVPCGLMRDLLGLSFSGCRDFRLIGVDLDRDSIELAIRLAKEYNLSDKVEFSLSDAWELPFAKRFSFLTSNGLTTYEPDHKMIVALYSQFSKVLVPGGVLVTSFATPQSEWEKSHLDQEYLILRKIVFSDVINVKWEASHQTQDETKAYLQTAGFSKVDFFPSKSRMLIVLRAIK